MTISFFSLILKTRQSGYLASGSGLGDIPEKSRGPVMNTHHNGINGGKIGAFYQN